MMAIERLLTVTELGRDIGVTARTLRFYEDKGLIMPQRAGSTRVYTHRDRARMILILRGKRLGFSLREIKEYLDLYESDTSQREQIQLLLRGVNDRIERLEQQSTALLQTLKELTEIRKQAEAALAGNVAMVRTARG
jgi:DNA-binding transcriptional MerR regulator